jgi:hypothetical protein
VFLPLCFTNQTITQKAKNGQIIAKNVSGILAANLGLYSGVPEQRTQPKKGLPHFTLANLF